MNKNMHRQVWCLGHPALGSKARERRGRLLDEQGVAITEFALVLPLLMLLLLGIIDFGKAFNYWLDETDIAHQGARWAAVDRNPGLAAGDTLQEYLRKRADTTELELGSGVSTVGPLRVCVSFPLGTSNVGDPVEVRIQTTYQWLPFISSELGIFQTTLTGSATMRIEQAPTGYSEADNLTPC